jgi:hypothetical protein
MFSKLGIHLTEMMFRRGWEMYGALYEDNPAGTPITITTGGTFYGWVTATSGVLKQITADFTGAADGLLIPDGGAGDYMVMMAASFSGTPNSTFKGAVFIDGVETHGGFTRKLGAGGDVGAASIMDLFTIPGGKKVDLRFTSDGDLDEVKVYDVDLIIMRMHD